ncbi:YybH family protein [Gemmatimonadota bacterium]
MRFRPLAVLILFAACQPAAPPEMTDAEKAEVEQAIADLWTGFEEVLLSEDKNVEEYLAFWTEDARILEPGMDMAGRDLFDSFGEFWGSGGEIFTFALESYEVFVHGDVAYQIGQYDESFQFPGAEPAEAHNYCFMRFEKNADGVWQIDRLVAGPREAPADG